MIKRAKNAQLAGSFDRWTEAVDEIVDLRRKMIKIVNRMRERVVSQVFYAWFEHVEAVVGGEPEVEVEVEAPPTDEVTLALLEMERRQQQKEQQELERRFKKAAMRMANACVATAWATWLEEHDKVGELKRVMRRMLDARLSQSFLRWVEAWEEIRHVRAVMLRISHRMKHRTALAAFERWCEMAGEAQHMRVVVNRAVQKMVRRQLAGAFERWLEMAEEAKATRVLVKRSLAKIMNRAMIGAWERWCEMMEEAADLRRKMRLCANMMMNKALATGWRLWCEAVQDARDERTAHEELVGKAVRKMMNRQLAGAWDCAVDPRGGWKEKYETWRDYTMPKLKLAAGRMMNRVTAGAFKTWHENALAAAEARLEEERRKLDRANRIIRRMMNRIVSDAFSGWHHAARAALEIKMKTKRAVMKMQRRQFAGAFSRWLEMVAEKAALRNLMERTVQRMKKRQLSTAFSKWRDDVRDSLDARLREKSADEALQAKCYALIPQLETAHQVLVDWVRAGGLRAMGGITGADVKLGTRKILGEVRDMIAFLGSLVAGERSLKQYRDRAEDVVDAATEVLQAVMHHVSLEAVYVRKALLLMREARAKHANDLKAERARMISLLRARLAALLRTEEARMRASFVKLMHHVKRDGGSKSGGGKSGGGGGGGKVVVVGGGGGGGNAAAGAPLPGHLQIPRAPGEGELSAESQAAIESLVEAIASLEQASSQWEDFSERLIDAGEFHTSAGGVKIVDEDAGPEQSKPGLRDFEALMGQQFGGMSPKSSRAEAVMEQKSRKSKEWEPQRKPAPRVSHVSLRAEDAIERAAPTRRPPRHFFSAVAEEERDEASRAEARMPRMSQKSGGGGGEGSVSYDTSHSNSLSHGHGGAPRLSVHELRADVRVATAKLPVLPIPRRLKEKLRYHEENRLAPSSTAAFRVRNARDDDDDAQGGARTLRDSLRSDYSNDEGEEDDDGAYRDRRGDEHYDEQMSALLRTRDGGGGGGYPVPRPRMLDPAAGGHGTRPTIPGELVRGPSLVNLPHLTGTDSLAALYTTRRRSPPRRVDSGGLEVEGMYAARTASRSGRFIRPFKTAASQQWSVSGEPWLGEGFDADGDADGKGGGGGMGSRSDSFISREGLLEGKGKESSAAAAAGAAAAAAAAGAAERPKTSSSKMPSRYNRGGPSPTLDPTYIGDEGEVIDSWPHQQDSFGGSLRVKDSKGDFFDTERPAKSPYPRDRRYL